MSFGIFNTKGFWRLDDQKKCRGVMYVSNLSDAIEWNEKHWGIFWTVNSLKDSSTRTESNLKSLDYWYVDIDSGDKEDQLKKINEKLTPSIVVESKNGFHVYWKIKNILEPTASNLERYKKTLRQLVKTFSGDPNATDAARILRIPCFLHWKNIDDPYLIRLNRITDKSYTQREMDFVFGVEKQGYVIPKEITAPSGDNIFAKASQVNCLTALERLSGTSAVCGETYKFKRTRTKHNIWVNNKSSSCWVDANGFIGSADKGGPTVCQWLFWFHRDWYIVARYLEEYFPELKGE